MQFPSTGFPWVDTFLSLITDTRFLVPFFIVYGTFLRSRQPTPKKGGCNKAVFITGCDTGLGHEIAKRLHYLGMHVFAGCLRPEGSGARALKELNSDRLHVVPLDVTNEKQIQEAVKYVESNLPSKVKGLFGLVNNAGVLSYVNFELMNIELCKEVIDVNLLGAMRVTKHFLPLIKKEPGRIATITSILARLTYPNVAVYAATKHALNGFFSSLRHDLANTGIHIATVEPGDLSTTTEIMQWTRQHLDEMWSVLTPEEQKVKKYLYEDAKKRVNKQELPQSEQREKYKLILNDIEDAVLGEEPKHLYVSAPFRQRIMLWILRNIPEDWSFSLITKNLK